MRPSDEDLLNGKYIAVTDCFKFMVDNCRLYCNVNDMGWVNAYHDVEWFMRVVHDDRFGFEYIANKKSVRFV